MLCIHLVSIAWPWHWTVSPSFLLVWGVQTFQLIDFLISCGQNQLHMSQAACIPWAPVGFEEATGCLCPLRRHVFSCPVFLLVPSPQVRSEVPHIILCLHRGGMGSNCGSLS